MFFALNLKKHNSANSLNKIAILVKKEEITSLCLSFPKNKQNALLCASGFT